MSLANFHSIDDKEVESGNAEERIWKSKKEKPQSCNYGVKERSVAFDLLTSTSLVGQGVPHISIESLSLPRRTNRCY